MDLLAQAYAAGQRDAAEALAKIADGEQGSAALAALLGNAVVPVVGGAAAGLTARPDRRVPAALGGMAGSLGGGLAGAGVGGLAGAGIGGLVGRAPGAAVGGMLGAGAGASLGSLAGAPLGALMAHGDKKEKKKKAKKGD